MSTEHTGPHANKPDRAVPETTRAAIVAQIEARLQGRISDAALAKWAFDRFYAEELETETFEEDAEEVIADALDALMFGDEPQFALAEPELRDVLAQLRES